MRHALVFLALTSFSRIGWAQEDPELRNWVAPPYWAPAAAATEAGAAGDDRGEKQGGREALALPSPALPFVAIPPCRIVDTRGGAPFTGGKYLAGESRDYQLSAAGAPCNGIPATAAAFSLNFTVTQTDGAGFLAAYPRNGRPVPLASTLNYVGAQTIANGAVVPGDATGYITVIAGVSGTHVIVDVNGYYAGTGVVTTLNALKGDVTLSAGTNVSITPGGNTLTISAGGGPVVSSLNALTGAVTLAGGGATTVTPGGNTLTISTPAGWDLSGNSGTNPASNYLGTSDGQPLEIRVNGQRVARFEPAFGLPNVILGDRGNSVLAGATMATVSGGGWASLFGAGDGDNIVTGSGGTVAGGIGNQAGDNDGNPYSGQYVTVGGGFYNEAYGEIATIAGGHLNRATGARSMVPGGYLNEAGGDTSFAAGFGAKVRTAAQTGTTGGDYGTFVWADGQGGDLVSTGANQFLVRAGGGVGINTNSPIAALDVRGPASPGAGAVYGRAQATSGFSIGVRGDTSSTGGIAVWGYSTPTDSTGFPIGVEGRSDSPIGVGVNGFAAAGSGVNYAIRGATNSPTGWAGYFLGNVHVTGILSKGGGSFRIDHPLDPKNKYLSHSFVESPDMKNIYDGVVVTDGQGYATVELPDWFEALNRDFRYQLTVLDETDADGFVQAKVVRGVASNRFTVRTSSPNTIVSWQVTGIRKDAFAERSRIRVEEMKPENERGRYLYPEAHGEPRELRIGGER